jgi:hypothetical protein
MLQRISLCCLMNSGFFRFKWVIVSVFQTFYKFYSFIIEIYVFCTCCLLITCVFACYLSPLLFSSMLIFFEEDDNKLRIFVVWNEIYV